MMNDRHILDGLSAGLICHAVCHVSAPATAIMNISQKRSGWPLFFERLLLTGLLAGRLVLPVLVLFFLSAIISPL